MTTAYVINLSSQIQSLSIPLNGLVYQFFVYWSQPNGTWMLDISDAQGNLMIGGIPLVTGRDLLAPFKYLKIGGQLQVQSIGSDPLKVPGINDLGVTGFLYYVPDNQS